MSDKNLLRFLCITISVGCLSYLLYVGIVGLLFLHVIAFRQTNGISFQCVKSRINQMVGSNAWFHQFSKNKPLIGVIISHEILPRIFALPGSFQFSATLWEFDPVPTVENESEEFFSSC